MLSLPENVWIFKVQGKLKTQILKNIKPKSHCVNQLIKNRSILTGIKY